MEDASVTVALVRRHPESGAGILEQLEPAEAATMLTEWPPEVAAQVVERMLPHLAGEVLKSLGDQACTALLLDLEARTAVRMLQQLDAEDRTHLLVGLPEELRQELEQLAEWPQDSAGGMMDPRVVTLSDDLNVRETIETIRRATPGSLHYLYVTNRQKHLLGVLLMRDLLLARDERPIREIMRTELITVPVDYDRAALAEVFEAHGFAVLPVVDEEQRLVGVVRHDAVIEAARDEAYEDLQIMAGAGAGERALDPVHLVVKRRLPWLLVNLATAFAAAVVVGFFEGTIKQVTALAILLPIVAGQSGNTGAQTLAVVMRGLAMGEVRHGVRWRLLRKEVLGGLLNGLAVALVCGIAIWAWDGRAVLGLVIASSMLLAMGLATAAAAMIPVGIHALGRDPAQSASIFLTTVTDLVGFGVFLGIAALAMPYLLEVADVAM